MQESSERVTTRGSSMMAEDHESSSLKDVLQEALVNREHGILHLNYKGLVQFPSQLVSEDDFTHIQVIYAKRNLITRLPPEIHKLSGLKILYLHSNNLSCLPEEICQLEMLESLDVSMNLFTSIPDVVCRCPGLKQLFMSSNRLTSIPHEIGALRQLSVLNLMDNKLTSIPPEIGQCCCLVTLQLDRNRLTMLPRQIVALHRLNLLSAVGNDLFVLPTMLNQLPNLKHLYMDSNPRLCSVPFTLYSKEVGVSRCGTERPTDGRRIEVGGLVGVLQPEIQVWYDEGSVVEQPKTLLEWAYRAVHQCRDQLPVSSLPKQLAELVEFPAAYCHAPSGCDQPIFTWAYVHLLHIPWVQRYALGGNERVTLMALCCSLRCLHMLKCYPIPT